MDWYFDFLSPYSYLQLERMPAWPSGVVLNPKPILFAGLLNHYGQKGPAEIPEKRAFTYRHVQWIAGRDGIAFRFPPRHPFNSINVLRLAVAQGNDLATIRAIFRRIWAEGGEVDTPQGWSELVKSLGIADADARISDPAVKARLRANGDEAIAAGVFGVPTFVIDGMVIWGYDATQMAVDYVRDRARFETPEWRRLENLPVGASRA